MEEDKQLIIYINQHTVDKIKIAVIILCVCILLCLILIINNSITKINGYKVYKQYEIQVQAIAFQEQQKTEEMKNKEQEKEQEKENIPSLTDERKRKYRKYL